MKINTRLLSSHSIFQSLVKYTAVPVHTISSTPSNTEFVSILNKKSFYFAINPERYFDIIVITNYMWGIKRSAEKCYQGFIKRS